MPNAVVVGHTSGIGRETSQRLEASGHAVFGFSRTASGHRSTVWDVADEFPESTHLPNEIHALIYCPGTIDLRPFKRISISDFQHDLEINLFGAIKVVQALEGRLRAGNASVVLFSTVAVANGMPFHSSIAASKGALEALSRSLAAEFAPDVRFNCIAPSLTDTSLAQKLLNSDAKRTAAALRHPTKSIGDPADIAQMALFLVSEHGRFITGQVIGMDGGLAHLSV
jgi:3-oxoacyl-[acyl-carrier protein] reductase